MTKINFHNIKDLAKHYDMLLFDMWGVMIEGMDVYDGVVEVLNHLAESKKVLFVTNAPRPNGMIVENLLRWGVKHANNDVVFTSGDVAHSMIEENYLAKNIKPKILHLGKERNPHMLQDIDHHDVDDVNQADILLLTLYRDENENHREYDELLANAAKCKNLVTICANPDTIVPNNGMLRYCPGYFATIIEKHGGTVIRSGKPKAEIYQHIFQKYPNVPKNKILMIGDTFETDILGAQTVGIDSALVLTGNSKRIHGGVESLDDKLRTIEQHANEMQIYPKFVTSF